MFAIAVNALYTTLRRRGTTRQLSRVIVVCVLSALLLLPALVWYNMRFGSEQATLSMVEVGIGLVYISLWGWLMPLGITSSYCLFTQPRTSANSVYLPSQRKRTTRGNAIAVGIIPPRRQPGVSAPFVFGEDVPWGWLEHCEGRFQGQRLALKRTVVSIGREEDNDIWLDDDTASRYHAELAWSEGQACLTDCDSLNGVLLNRRRIRGTVVIQPGDLVEIGSHSFLFDKAEPQDHLNEHNDPLLSHSWRPALAPAAADTMAAKENSSPGTLAAPAKSAGSEAGVLPKTRPLEHGAFPESTNFIFPPLTPHLSTSQLDEFGPKSGNHVRQDVQIGEDTLVLDQSSAFSQPATPPSVFVIRNGEMEGTSFLLDRPVITIGRSFESDLVIEDSSISRLHAQFLRQVAGDYVLDLASRNGTKVNDILLNAPQLLKQGDIVSLGNVQLEYTSVQEAHTTPMPLSSLVPPISGPVPILRLPSKHKGD